jgi:hypothetical protein
MEYFKARFAAAGYKLPELLRDIALSNAFSAVRAEPGKPTATVVTTTSARPEQMAQQN